MATTKHYETVDYKVTSDDTDTEAILRVQRKSDDVVLARVYVEYGDAWFVTYQFDRATMACDVLQAQLDSPTSPASDWPGGKVGIGGLPVI